MVKQNFRTNSDVVQVISEIFVVCIKSLRGDKVDSGQFPVVNNSLREHVDWLASAVRRRDASTACDHIHQIQELLGDLMHYGEIEGSISSLDALAELVNLIWQKSVVLSGSDYMRMVAHALGRLAGTSEREFYVTNNTAEGNLVGFSIRGVLSLATSGCNEIADELVGDTPFVQSAVADEMEGLLFEEAEILYRLEDLKELQIVVCDDGLVFKLGQRLPHPSMTIIKLNGENDRSLYVAIKINKKTGKVELDYAAEPGTKLKDYGWSKTKLKSFVGKYLVEDAFFRLGSQKEMESF